MINVFELVSRLPEDQKTFAGKFVGGIAENKDLDSIDAKLSEVGIFPQTARDLQVYVLDLEEINRNLTIMKGFIDLYQQLPYTLKYDALTLKARIENCIRHSIPIKDENGIYYSHVYNYMEYMEMANAKESIEPAPTQNNVVDFGITKEQVLPQNFETYTSMPQLTPDAYESTIRIFNTVASIGFADDSTYNIIGNLVLEGKYSDEEIIELVSNGQVMSTPRGRAA